MTGQGKYGSTFPYMSAKAAIEHVRKAQGIDAKTAAADILAAARNHGLQINRESHTALLPRSVLSGELAPNGVLTVTTMQAGGKSIKTQVADLQLLYPEVIAKWSLEGANKPVQGLVESSVRRRGPQPRTRERVMNEMRRDIAAGENLVGMKEKVLAHKYGDVSRDTVRKALQAVLAEYAPRNSDK